MSEAMKNTDIKELFTRGVREFVDPDGGFERKLAGKAAGTYNKDVIIKIGVDPTRPDIHLGHAVILRRLRQFQDLGCKVVFLVGDFTAQIGDPTGKSKVRPEVEQRVVEENMKTYLDQVGKILRTDEKYFSWIRNSHWFYGVADIVLPENATIDISVRQGESDGRIAIPPNSFVGKAFFYQAHNMQATHLKRQEVVGVTLRGLLWTLRHITHSRLIERDMFGDRIKKGEELFMHEMLYPVLQGIDSFVINQLYGSCDLEIGGTDQTFNMLMGRDVMRINGQEPQAVMSMELLVGLDGTEKMSKSLDNYIGIIDNPNDMFGKIMSVPDRLMRHYFDLCTYTPADELEKIEETVRAGKENPRDIKMRLAKEVTAIYHGTIAAERAAESFTATFSKRMVPSDIETVKVAGGTELQELLRSHNLIASGSEYRRLLQEGAIRVLADGAEDKVTDVHFKVERDIVVKVGKKRFLSIAVS